MAWLVAGLLVTFFVVDRVSCQDKTLEWNGITLTGEQSSYMGASFIQFRGIKYAEAERYGRPKMFTVGSDFSAKNFGKMCIQKKGEWTKRNLTTPNDSDFDEDCLNLNVFVPGNAVDNTQRKPVMVGFHAGNYQYGGAKMYNGGRLATAGDIIVVTMNFRLNVYGFLSTGNDVVPGNMGLWDQNMALRWVQTHIEAFGGDKNKVTLFGHCSGGSSVSLHLMSPQSKGLFDRALSISGMEPTAMFPTQEATETFARNRTGCEDLTIECIKQRSWESLYDSDPFTIIRPVIDGENGFIPEDPDEILTKYKYNVAEYMAGFAEDDPFDRLFTFIEFRQPVIDGDVSVAQVMDFLNTRPWKTTIGGPTLNDLVLNQYFPDLSSPVSNARGLVNAIFDRRYVGPTMRGLRYFSVINPSYLFYVTNGDGVHPYRSALNLRVNQVNASDALVKMWTDFAKGNTENIPRFDNAAAYSKINGLTGEVTTANRPRPQGDSFWNNIVLTLTNQELCEEEKASIISASGAETILFLLILATVVLLMFILVMFANRT